MWQKSFIDELRKLANMSDQKLFNDKERKEGPLATWQNDIKVTNTESISGDTNPTEPPKLPKKMDSLIKAPK